jgi:hypothetical protein
VRWRGASKQTLSFVPLVSFSFPFVRLQRCNCPFPALSRSVLRGGKERMREEKREEEENEERNRFPRVAKALTARQSGSRRAGARARRSQSTLTARKTTHSTKSASPSLSLSRTCRCRSFYLASCQSYGTDGFLPLRPFLHCSNRVLVLLSPRPSSSRPLSPNKAPQDNSKRLQSLEGVLDLCETQGSVLLLFGLPETPQTDTPPTYSPL